MLERSGTLECIILEFGAFGRVAGLKLGAEGGVAKQALLILLRSEIIAENPALECFAFCITDARRRADGEDE